MHSARPMGMQSHCVATTSLTGTLMNQRRKGRSPICGSWRTVSRSQNLTSAAACGQELNLIDRDSNAETSYPGPLPLAGFELITIGRSCLAKHRDSSTESRVQKLAVKSCTA